MLIGGFFSEVGGVNRQCVARLNSDGTLDTRFDPGTGAGGPEFPSVLGIAQQADGRTVIGGNFTAVNGSGRNYVARLLSDGLTIRLSESDVILQWPTNLSAFRLQWAPSLTPTEVWTDCTNMPAVVGPEFMVTNPMVGITRFYRLND